MKIYLARHGQSQWQIDNENGGWDSPLTVLGQQQAKHLATWLSHHPKLDFKKHINIGALFASPLIRAQETANPIAHALKLPITTDDNLQEADFWVSEHLPNAAHPMAERPLHTPPPIYQTLKERSQQALSALVATAEESEGDVLAVTHGGLLSTMLRQVLDNDAISFWLYNTSLNLLEWKRGRWHLVHLNLWDHLPPELRTY